MIVLMHLVSWKCSSAVICMTLCTSCICLNLSSTLYMKGREAVFKIMGRCILQIPVQLQHWLENFAVIVSARGIAAVFLGKATHLNYCCTSSQQLFPQGLSLEKPNKAILSLLNSMLYFLLKNLLAFFCWFLEVRFCLLVDVEFSCLVLIIYYSVHFLWAKKYYCHSYSLSFILLTICFVPLCLVLRGDKFLLAAIEITQYVSELLHVRFWNVVANQRIKF